MRQERRVLCLATLGTLISPVTAIGQMHTKHRLGFLSPISSAADGDHVELRMDLALGRLGWEEGRNIVWERRFAAGDPSKLDSLAGQLVQADVDLIVAALSPAVAAAKRATSTIPIVMGGAAYPVESGLVESLARPGGNVSGTGIDQAALFEKSLQIVNELAPNRRRLAVLAGPIGQGGARLAEVIAAEREKVARAFGMSVRTFAVERAEDVNGAVDAVIAQQSDILFVTASPANLSRWPNIIAAAREYKIFTFGQAPGLVRNGCAMYCGPRLEEVIERSASFVDRVLRGAKIGELPVELPTRFDLTLNLKALGAIGLRPSREILLQATDVIE